MLLPSEDCPNHKTKRMQACLNGHHGTSTHSQAPRRTNPPIKHQLNYPHNQQNPNISQIWELASICSRLWRVFFRNCKEIVLWWYSHMRIWGHDATRQDALMQYLHALQMGQGQAQRRVKRTIRETTGVSIRRTRQELFVATAFMIYAVFRGIALLGPDESGHYERVGRMLTNRQPGAFRRPAGGATARRCAGRPADGEESSMWPNKIRPW